MTTHTDTRKISALYKLIQFQTVGFQMLPFFAAYGRVWTLKLVRIAAEEKNSDSEKESDDKESSADSDSEESADSEENKSSWN